MKRLFILTLCFLITATSHSVEAARPRSLVAGLRHDLSAMTQKGSSWINSIKKNYNGLTPAEAVEKTKQTILGNMPEALQSTVNKAYEINYADLPSEVKTWINSIKENYDGLNAAEAVEKTGQTISEKMPEALQSTVNKAYKFNYADLPNEVKTWITEHPYQTTFYIANGIVFFYPSLLTGPVLWSLGWTSTGPRAGSAAAALMAKFGVVSSRGAYAFLQSSAMGGYGSALVQGVARVGSGILGSSQWLNAYLQERGTSKIDDTAELKRRQEGEGKVDEPAKVKANL